MGYDINIAKPALKKAGGSDLSIALDILKDGKFSKGNKSHFEFVN